MGNIMFIKGKKVCVKPERTMIEVIPRLKPSTTPKGCRNFAEAVNFLSLFYLTYKKLLKPKYGLTRIGRVYP